MPAPTSPESVWAPLAVASVVNVQTSGATGNGIADDTAALTASITALPAGGGVVYFPPGTYRKTNLWAITKSHVKLWAPEGATLHGETGNAANKQATKFTGTTGAGVFGLKFTSDATVRGGTKDDHQLVFDGSTDNEAEGVEIAGSRASGIFVYGATNTYVHGCYIHHTYADHIHHTATAANSWVWGNCIYNEAPSNGDDGIACVTYGPAAARNHDMEWWANTVFHTDGGRGLAVIGGDNIDIHDNVVMHTAAAGILIASEPGYDSSSSSNITVRRNVVYRAAHTVNSHSGILLSGRNGNAAAIGPVTLEDNIVWGQTAQAFRTEGTPGVTGVTNTGLLSTEADLPVLPDPETAGAVSTAVLKTRDTSFAPANTRTGLYRMHIKKGPAGFLQRFEYVVKGPPATLHAWTVGRTAAGDHVVGKRTVAGTGYAIVLTSAPTILAVGLSTVTHSELRQPANAWLWDQLQ